MAGRKIRSAEEARACLSAAANSGMERAAWARQHGIDGRSLNAWRMNLERQAGDPVVEPLRLVELVAAPVAQRPPSLRVSCGPFEVHVDEDFDERQLSRVLRVLAAC